MTGEVVPAPAILLDQWLAAALGAGAGAGAGAGGAAAEAAAVRQAATAAGTELLGRWQEPHRHYHDLAHLARMLSVVDEHAGFATAPDAVRLAAWCHDAVYDPRAPADANERDSAALAAALLRRLGVPAAVIAEVERLVLLTAGHRPTPDDRNGALLCDADLAILAAPAAEYDRYVAAIRREYRHLPEPTFRAGRAEVLRKLLALPTRYRIPKLARRWEPLARANLTRELAALTDLADPDSGG